jgi:hypothetical protein
MDLAARAGFDPRRHRAVADDGPSTRASRCFPVDPPGSRSIEDGQANISGAAGVRARQGLDPDKLPPYRSIALPNPDMRCAAAHARRRRAQLSVLPEGDWPDMISFLVARFPM